MKILTFDIEEFTLYSKCNYSTHYVHSLLDKILDMLEEKGVTATFFCLGEIAREYPEQVKKIFARGHSIGCHSDKHNWLSEFTAEQLYSDTRLALDSIEQVIGHKVRLYRAPAFSIGEKNSWAIEVLAECGIKIDCSIFPATRDFGGFPSFSEDIPTILDYQGTTMKELPMSITSLGGIKMAYSGGGYFRMLPYSFIKKTMNASDYVMTYFHLRDFDTQQKKIISPRYFKSYYGIKGAYAKFERLFLDFNFVDVEYAAKKIDWENCKIIII